MRFVVELDPDSSVDSFELEGVTVQAVRLFGEEPFCEHLLPYQLIEDGIDADSTSAWDAAHDYARRLENRGVRRVWPDLPFTRYARHRDGTRAAEDTWPPDPRWGLAQIRAPEVWKLEPPPGNTTTGLGIRIGHPDTGYTTHPEMTGAFDLDSDQDFMDVDADARDPLGRGQTGHGTSTGSVIAGPRHGRISGVAPDATIVPLRVMKRVWHVRDSRVARAVAYAATPAIGCHVISMSLGGIGFQFLERAIQCAIDYGLIVLAAAGNYVRFVVPPAAFRQVIAVAASTYEEDPWFHSSRGSKVAVTAPGHRVYVASYTENAPQTDRVWRHDGTSFAVAHVAGAAALWLGFHGRDALIQRHGIGNLQRAFLECLVATARAPQGWDQAKFGAGIVDAPALVQCGDATGEASGALEPPADPIEDAIDEVAHALGNSVAREPSQFREELRYLLVEHAPLFEDGVLPEATFAATGIVASRASDRLREALGW